MVLCRITGMDRKIDLKAADRGVPSSLESVFSDNTRRAYDAQCRRLQVTSRQVQVDAGSGQNRTLRSPSALWPPVFADEQEVAPPKG